jgi:hypothetical protein
MSIFSPQTGASTFDAPDPMKNLAEDEARLLRSAQDYASLGRLEDCSIDTMRGLAVSRGVDFATAVLFDRLGKCERHRAFIRRIDARRRVWRDRAFAPQKETTLLIVPGAYYREYPRFGGDGRLLREVAELMGFRVELIPLPSTAALAVSASQINDHLLRHNDRHPARRIILASLSKGSADVKAALLRTESAEAFSRVSAWIDFSGVSDGTPLATRMVESKPLAALGRFWFWWRGYNWQMMRDLADGPTSVLNGPARVPPHMRTMHVLGVPLTAHVTTRMARRDHRRLSALGPNDGCTLLAHASRFPGEVYPVWGADHYLKPRGAPGEMQSLAAAILSDAAAPRPL